MAKPPKERANLQRRNNELANEVEQLTKQVSQLRSSKTTLSNENRDLQETIVQVHYMFHPMQLCIPYSKNLVIWSIAINLPKVFFCQFLHEPTKETIT